MVSLCQQQENAKIVLSFDLVTADGLSLMGVLALPLWVCTETAVMWELHCCGGIISTKDVAGEKQSKELPKIIS